MSIALAGAISLAGLAYYAGHHVGDYWVQTDDQAQHKGDEGREGVRACLAHVATYTLTQGVFVVGAGLVAGGAFHPLGLFLGLLISGVTHYLADRREHGIMFRLARMLPGKARFLKLGAPRGYVFTGFTAHGHVVQNAQVDNPSLGTGAWALDQSWHIFWGVFVAALVTGGIQ